ncbi:hypothetical protein SK128_017036, partial [Halocaridina rubra]
MSQNSGRKGRKKVDVSVDVLEGAVAVGGRKDDSCVDVNKPAVDDGSGGNETDENCGNCETVVKCDDKAMQCKVCKVWFHTVCEGMPEEVYDCIMSVGDQITWYCTHCKRGCVQLYKCMDKIEEQNKVLWNKQGQKEREIKAWAEIVGQQESNRAMNARMGVVEAQSVALATSQ